MQAVGEQLEKVVEAASLREELKPAFGHMGCMQAMVVLAKEHLEYGDSLQSQSLSKG